MNRGYVLHSRWHLDASLDAVWAVLGELLATDDPMPWWPGVTVVSYADGVLSLRVRSRLGYAVRVRLADLDLRPPDGLSFTAAGDLSGRGEVAIAGDDRSSTVDIDWRVEARTAWMRRTQWALRPVFVLGHRGVMRRGERHLARWLARA